MSLRRQPPVYSPLTLHAVLAAAAAVFERGDPGECTISQSLRTHYQPKDLLLTDSGTSALTLAIRGVLADHPGAPVALPAYGCYDLATVVDGVSGTALLYDVDPATLAPDLESLERALQRGAAVVVVAHLFGIPVDVRAILQLARRAGATVVEDAAQGAGAVIRGRPVGTAGSLGVLSFGRGKGITGGSGGALLANDVQGVRVCERAREWLGSRTAGWPELGAVLSQWLLARPGIYALPSSLPFLHLGETLYRQPIRPRGLANAAQGALSVTWSLGAEELRVRRRHAHLLLAVLQENGRAVRAVQHPPQAHASYLRLPLLSMLASASLVTTGARSLGVMPGYPRVLSELEGFRPRCLNRDAALPGARQLARHLCTLPTHSKLTAEDLRRLESWMKMTWADCGDAKIHSVGHVSGAGRTPRDRSTIAGIDTAPR